MTIWNNEADATFGVERLFRLFLALSAYCFLGIYIRHYSGKAGLLARKLALDAFVVFKVLFPAVVLWTGAYTNTWIQMLIVYFGIETVLYVASILFLSDIYKAPISHKRSYLMFMLNYIELSLGFAVLYAGMNGVPAITSGIDAAYFSFVTGFTVGFGDMLPTTASARMLVVIQSLCSLFFITLALAKAVASFELNHAKKANDTN